MGMSVIPIARGKWNGIVAVAARSTLDCADAGRQGTKLDPRVQQRNRDLKTEFCMIHSSFRKFLNTYNS
jgi:hypothetical protein